MREVRPETERDPRVPILVRFERVVMEATEVVPARFATKEVVARAVVKY